MKYARRTQATYTAVAFLVLAALGPTKKIDLRYLVKRLSEKELKIDRIFVVDGLLRAGKQKEGI